MDDRNPHWKRYLSLHFLASKMQEKGIVWCLHTGTFRFLSCLISCLLYPILYLMGVRFLPIFVSRIGHLAVEPDCYLKEGILGLRPGYFGIVLAPSHQVANHHLLNYWRQHLRIVTSPWLCSLLHPLARPKTLEYDVGRYAVAINSSGAAFAIQTKYNGKPPLLSLRESDRKSGWECLQKLGVPEDAWFVCVHCREPGYAPGEDFHNFRNADIDSYLSAIEAIVDHGGWCIRMGDPTMKPLPAMKHVIDYAHHDIRSDWMDIFLCASCKYFLGSDSGLHAVADVFGTPCAIANKVPMSVVLPYGPSDIGIPKLMWSCKEERYLTFAEVLSAPIGNFRFTRLYSEVGMRVVENSPEDIKDLAVEMLEITEGTVTYSAEDERLQERFKSLVKPGHYSYGASSRVGRDFLRKYAWLLPDDESQEVGTRNLGAYDVS